MAAENPGGTGANWLERFGHALDVMTGAYGQLDALSQRQMALIESKDMDRLLALMSERQTLITALEEACPVFDQARRNWEERASTLAEAQNAELSRRVRAIERMAADIAERDKQAGRELDRLRDQLADEMAGLGRGSAAVNAYAPHRDATPPRFQDRKG